MSIGMRLIVVLALAASSSCSVDSSARSLFERDVPLPDAGPGSGLSAWRADQFVISLPVGLASFQSAIIEPAVKNSTLNFLIVSRTSDLTSATWSISLGSGDQVAMDQYRFSGQYTPVDATVVNDTRSLQLETLVDVTITARSSFDIPVPISGAQVTATLSGDSERLENGLIVGTILGEVAAVTLLDLQNDGDPSNDTALVNFLGEADLDEDGDEVVDDFSFKATFASGRIEFLENNDI